MNQLNEICYSHGLKRSERLLRRKRQNEKNGCRQEKSCKKFGRATENA